MLKTARSYEEACRHFRWRVPERYNLAFDVCDRQTMAGSDGHRTALMVEDGNGRVERYTFALIRLLSNRLANVLKAQGLAKGDRVVISYPQGLEAALTVLAVLKVGAVLVPLAPELEASEAQRRIRDAAPKLALLSPEARLAFGALWVEVLDFDGNLWGRMQNAPDSFAPEVTNADDSAFLFYPDNGLGVLHGHKSLLGSLPALEFGLDFFPQFGDILWTPNCWMRFDGLVLGLLAAWHHGVAVVASTIKDPVQQLALMGRHGVRTLLVNAFHFKSLTLAAADHPHPILRTIGVTGGMLDSGFHNHAVKVFDCQVNEIWGNLELGAVCANNARVMDWHAGSVGRAAPGITVDAVNGAGFAIQAGETALLGLSPVSHSGCIGHWGTGETNTYRADNGWWVSDVMGKRDLDGYVWPEMEPVRLEVMARSDLNVVASRLDPVSPEDRPVVSGKE